MPHIKARTLGWIAIYLAILPLFMIPEIVWASHGRIPGTGSVVTETQIASPAVDPGFNK